MRIAEVENVAKSTGKNPISGGTGYRFARLRYNMTCIYNSRVRA